MRPDLQQLEVEGLHGFDVLRDEEQRVEQLLLARTRDQLPLRATATAGLAGGRRDGEFEEGYSLGWHAREFAAQKSAMDMAKKLAAQKWAMEMAAAGPAGGQLRGLGCHLEGLGFGEVDGAPQRVRLGRQLEQVDKQPGPNPQRFVNLDPGGCSARFSLAHFPQRARLNQRGETAATPRKVTAGKPPRGTAGARWGGGGRAHVSMSSSFSMSLLPRASWWKCSSGVRITLPPRIHTHHLSRYETDA